MQPRMWEAKAGFRGSQESSCRWKTAERSQEWRFGAPQACDEAGGRAPKLLDIQVRLGDGELGTELGARRLRMTKTPGPGLGTSV